MISSLSETTTFPCESCNSMFSAERSVIPALAQRGLIQPRHDARHAGHQRLRAGDGQRRRIGLIAVQIQPFRDRPGHFQHDGHAAGDVALHVHGDRGRFAGDDRAVELRGIIRHAQLVLALAGDLAQIKMRVIGRAADAVVVGCVTSTVILTAGTFSRMSSITMYPGGS